MSPEEHVVTSYETTNLTDQALNELVNLIGPIYLRFYPSSSKERILKRLRHNKSTVLDLLSVNQTVCAFGIHYLLKIGDKSILFRDGTMVNDSEQSKGYYRLLVQHALDKYSPDFMATRTQNPRVYEMLRKFSATGSIYPSEGIVPPQGVVIIAHSLCLEGKLDPETLAVKDVYAKGQGREDAQFFLVRDEKVRDFFKRSLAKSDAFIVVVPIK